MGQSDLSEPVREPDEILAVIHLLRGQRVVLDADLARLYGVDTKRLNEQVRRNPGRFPHDFVFQLEEDEWDRLRSQFATSKLGRGGRRYMPMAFTEQGVAMLSSVLNSERAIAVNVEIMRAFVRFRRFLASHDELATKLKELEIKFEGKWDRHDQNLRMLFEAMRQLREEVRKPAQAAPPRRKIGFHADHDEPPKSKSTRQVRKASAPPQAASTRVVRKRRRAAK